MKRFLTTTALTAALIGSAGIAAAQSEDDAAKTRETTAMQSSCTVVDSDFETKLRENPETRAGYSTTMVRDVRALRDAAMILDAYGKQGACEEVAVAINDLVNNPQDARRDASNGEPMMGWNDSPSERSYEQAMSVTEGNGRLRADTILGADVRSSENEAIGEISDIVFDPKGSPAYAVIAYGGFLGLGESESAVPFSELKVSEDGDVFYVAMTEEQLESAPKFERGNFDWMQDEGWRQKNDEYFTSQTKSAG